MTEKKEKIIKNAVEKSKAGKFQLRNVSELIPHPTNARTHPAAQIKKIAASIKEFGFINPVLVDANNVIMAGHGRIEAAKKLGIVEIPTLCFDHLTEAQRRAYTLMDNRSALDSAWDENLLMAELNWLDGEGFDLSMTGFESGELDDFMAEQKTGLTDEDETPPVPAVPSARLGETWLLGPHRVRCGDSTSQDDVKALLGERVPHLMVTDPPYGVDYDPNWRNKADRANGKPYGASAIGTVENDGNADWREAWALFPGSVAYVWHAGKFGGIVQESLEETGFEIRNQIIWAKNVFAIGRGDYHWKHEPCWYAVRKGGKSGWNGSRKETTLWEIDKPRKSETGHSTQKPIECMRRPIVNNSAIGDAVYDPFLGSGTTVIAAETESRSCYGMELNPAYVDVIITRWQSFTGNKAIRESDGVTFDSLRPSEVAA